jgi:hypothetical protein
VNTREFWIDSGKDEACSGVSGSGVSTHFVSKSNGLSQEIPLLFALLDAIVILH